MNPYCPTEFCSCADNNESSPWCDVECWLSLFLPRTNNKKLVFLVHIDFSVFSSFYNSSFSRFTHQSPIEVDPHPILPLWVLHTDPDLWDLFSLISFSVFPFFNFFNWFFNIHWICTFFQLFYQIYHLQIFYKLLLILSLFTFIFSYIFIKAFHYPFSKIVSISQVRKVHIQWLQKNM